MADRGALLRLRRLCGVELPSRSSMRPARLCRAMTPPTWFGRAPASKGRQAKKAVSARTATTATKAAAPARQRGRTTPAKPAGGKRPSPTLGEQVVALADGKTQQEITAACNLARSPPGQG